MKGNKKPGRPPLLGKKVKPLWVRVPADLLQQVDDKLVGSGRRGQRSELIRRLLKMYVNGMGPEQEMDLQMSPWSDEFA